MVYLFCGGYFYTLLAYVFVFPGVPCRSYTVHCPCIEFLGLFCRGSCCFLLSSVHCIVFCSVWSCIQVCLFLAGLLCFHPVLGFWFFVLTSFIISWWVISLLGVSRTLLRPCMLMRRLSPVRLYSSRISFVLTIRRLFSLVVIDLLGDGPILWSILWACIALFFFIILGIWRYPVQLECVCIYMYVCVYIYVSVYVYIYICVYMCLCVCMYIYMYMYIYIYIYLPLYRSLYIYLYFVKCTVHICHCFIVTCIPCHNSAFLWMSTVDTIKELNWIEFLEANTGRGLLR